MHRAFTKLEQVWVMTSSCETPKPAALTALQPLDLGLEAEADPIARSHGQSLTGTKPALRRPIGSEGAEGPKSEEPESHEDGSKCGAAW